MVVTALARLARHSGVPTARPGEGMAREKEPIMEIARTVPAARWTRITALRLALAAASLASFLLASGASLKWN